MRVNLGRSARREAVEAASWYENQEEGLGARFLRALEAAQNRVGSNPLIYRCFRGDLRKCRFEVFPYVLVFRIHGDEIQVAAVMHTSRKPGYWENRS
jgi:plasmid stabilization system protein ParE